MPKYTTTRRVRHDGELHQAGAEITLDAKKAKPLLDSGAIKAKGIEAKGGDVTPGESQGGSTS